MLWKCEFGSEIINIEHGKENTKFKQTEKPKTY